MTAPDSEGLQADAVASERRRIIAALNEGVSLAEKLRLNWAVSYRSVVEIVGEQSPVVPSVGAVPVEVPCDLLEVVAKAIAETDDEDGCFDRVAEYDALTSEEREDFDRAHGYPHGDYEDCEYYRRRAATAYPLIAARVRAEERQRVQALRGHSNHLLQPVIGMARLRLARPDMPELNLAHVVERLYCALDAADHAVGEPGRADFDPDSYQRQGMQNPRAAGSAVPVATPGATGLDTAGIMRRFDQEISRSFDVIARMDMGRTGGSAATPTEPVDEVVCPNCQETIRARMSDQPEQEPIEDWPAVCPGCGALAPNLQLTNAPRCEHWFHRPPAAEQDGAVTEPGHA